MTDKILIRSFLNGNDNAFRELIRRYETLVSSTVIGMLGKCAEAEDVAQETFIRFYKGVPNFRGESKLGTYLTRIAINLSLNELKRRKRFRLLYRDKTMEEMSGIADSQTPKPYDGVKDLVDDAVQMLEPRFRSVVVLRLINGYSTRETAGILNIPEGTVLS